MISDASRRERGGDLSASVFLLPLRCVLSPFPRKPRLTRTQSAFSPVSFSPLFTGKDGLIAGGGNVVWLQETFGSAGAADRASAASVALSPTPACWGQNEAIFIMWNVFWPLAALYLRWRLLAGN